MYRTDKTLNSQYTFISPLSLLNTPFLLTPAEQYLVTVFCVAWLVLVEPREEASSPFGVPDCAHTLGHVFPARHLRLLRNSRLGRRLSHLLS